MLRKKKRIVRRYEHNPILTAEQFPGDIVAVFNCGIVKRADADYIMICRCEDSALGRYMWVAESSDGIHFTPRPTPLSLPMDDPVFREYCHGLKSYWDPRITRIADRYYIVHAADVTAGASCQLGLFEIDEEFTRLQWLGLISEPDNRNGVLFPEQINGKYHRLDRPNDNGGFDIWSCSSPDLLHWGVPRRVVAKAAVDWADRKLGPGAVPIKTPQGWLCIIHGVRRQCLDEVYSLGVMLLDLDDPTRLIRVSQRAILAPELPYELIGQSPSVVFTNGAILEPDGTVRIYYGAADQVVALALADLDDLLYAALHE